MRTRIRVREMGKGADGEVGGDGGPGGVLERCCVLQAIGFVGQARPRQRHLRRRPACRNANTAELSNSTVPFGVSTLPANAG